VLGALIAASILLLSVLVLGGLLYFFDKRDRHKDRALVEEYDLKDENGEDDTNF
jgi:hypothetical protein